MIQFGQQFGQSFGGVKKQEEEKKTSLQSKAPVVESPVGKQFTEQKSNIPVREPMQTYAVEGTILPGITDATANNIREYAKSNSNSPEEEEILASELYQVAVKGTQQKLYLKAREENKADMVKQSISSKDPEEKKQIDLSLKLSNLSDIFRKGAAKEGYDITDMNDKDVVSKFVSGNPDKQDLITDYLNGTINGVDVGRAIGLISEEEGAAMDQLAESERLSEMKPIDRIAEKLQGYEGAGGRLVRGAGDTLGGLVGGVEKAGEGIKNIAEKGDIVNTQAIKNDIVIAKFKEKYGRMPDLFNKKDKKIAEEMAVGIEQDPMFIERTTQMVEEQANIDETTTAENLLDIGEGTLTAGFTIANPYLMGAINVAADTEVGAKVLEEVGGILELGGSLLAEIPGLKQREEGLPEERKAEFHEFLGNLALVAISAGRGRGKAKGKGTEILKEKFTAEQLISEFEKGKFEPQLKQYEQANKILQPSKTDVKLGNDVQASRGLVENAEAFLEMETYAEGVEIAKKVKAEKWKPYQEGLMKANEALGQDKFSTDKSYGSALEGLTEILLDETGKPQKGLSSETLTMAKEVEALNNKYNTNGLDLIDRQKVKQLHTENNKMFTESGKETASFSSENLRGIRRDMKNDIETTAKEGGFADVKRLNQEYSDLIALEKMLKDQKAGATSQGARVETQTPMQKVVEFVSGIPGVKQIAVGPMQTAVGILIKNKGGNSLTAVEVQAKLPKMMKSLEKAGVSKAQINKFKNAM